LAPGQMARHYSPRTPVVLHERLTAAMAARGGPRDAWLFISKPRGHRPRDPSQERLFWLDAQGNLRRAARRLFSVLRELDEGGFRKIHVERPRGPGIAEALGDRLDRAASR
ncbi:MAG: Sua5 family C-terminal domain-containing protein, partial [Opitutaceae bacterium]